MASQPEVNVYSNRNELSSALAVRIARMGAGAASRRGRFSAALSGGSLMDIIGPALASAPLNSAIDWATWHVFCADERWVPKDSSESNYCHANRLLFTRVGIPAEQIHTADDSLDPVKTARTCETIMGNVLQPKSGRLLPVKTLLTSGSSR